METRSVRESFLRELRTALIHLYNPSVLRGSPLAALFGIDQRADAVVALRRALIGAIESLRPDGAAPPGTKTRRVYQILRCRYIEQSPQRAAASELGLSVRQLRREEKLGREMLADYLWAVHDLETRGPELASILSRPAGDASPADAGVPSRRQELEWLRSSVPAEMVHIGEVIQEVLDTVNPLLKSSSVSAEYTSQSSIPPVSVQRTILRQILMQVVADAIRHVPGGQIRVQADVLHQQVCVHLRATRRHGGASFRRWERTESLEMAEQLIHLCGGSLEIVSRAGGEEACTIRMVLPAAEQVAVLVIDDNVDTLQLFQRYLSGSRYHFIGAQDTQRALALAEQLAPQIVVLDVMMPENDGWKLLAHLREHPNTSSTLVIVCTILPQEELAMTLGAADYIRKPVSRAHFLSALDHQFDLLSRESC